MLGYFVWKITILRQKTYVFPILGGGGGAPGAPPPPPPWILPCIALLYPKIIIIIYIVYIKQVYIKTHNKPYHNDKEEKTRYYLLIWAYTVRKGPFNFVSFYLLGGGHVISPPPPPPPRQNFFHTTCKIGKTAWSDYLFLPASPKAEAGLGIAFSVRTSVPARQYLV